MKNILTAIQSTWEERAYPFVISRTVTLFLLCLGTALRIKHYLENRSLWIDEAYVAVDIISRSVIDTIRQGPIFIEQPRTPPGFAFIEQGFVALLGNNEYVLRLLPLLSGLLCLLLFYHVLKMYASRATAVLALAFFAILEPLVYYSAEVKPYSSDVCVTLFLYYLIALYHQKEKPLWCLGLLGLCGGYAVWFSYPSVFVLAALGLTTTVMSLFNNKWKNALLECLVYLFWLANFYFLYTLTISQMADSKYMWSFQIWKTSVLSAPFFSLESLVWLKNVFTTAFVYPVGLGYPYACAVFFFIGAWHVYRSNRQAFFKLVLPLVFVLSAACLRQFPFGGRLILFLVPVLLLFFCAGLVVSLKKCKMFSVPVGLVLLAFFFFKPVETAAHGLLHGRSREEMRGVMEFYAQNRQPGDGMVINDYALPQYWYYLNSLGIDYRTSSLVRGKYKNELVEGYLVGQIANELVVKDGQPPYVPYREIICMFSEDGILERFLVKLNRNRRLYIASPFHFFEQKRFWVILPSYQPKFKQFVLTMLDRQAVRLKEYEGRGSSIYLFELGRN